MQTNKSAYRGILGGLDNAAKQAEEKGFHDMMIIDTDCHFSQPLQEFTKTISKYSNKKWELPPDVFDKDFQLNSNLPKEAEGLREINAFANGIDTPLKEQLTSRFYRRLTRPEYPTHRYGGTSKTLEAETVIDRFTARMYDIGIKRSILYPAAFVYNLGMLPDHGLEVAVSNAFMDYMLEHFLGKYKEILTVIPVPANSPEKAADLIDRVGSEKGVVGINISPSRPVLFGDDMYNPIYEAAQRKGLVVTVHAGVYRGPPFDFDNNFQYAALQFPMTTMTQVSSVIAHGVQVRYPKLKWVWVEAGLSWIPFMMHRLDSAYERLSDDAPLLEKMPSEYMDEFYYTTQPIEHPRGGFAELQRIFEFFDYENKLLYASDYPHYDFDVPSSVYDIPFLSKRAKSKILGENAANLFRIT